MRITVVTPFLDRGHGTERALSEQLTRLAKTYDCDVHVYAQKVSGLTFDDPTGPIPLKGGRLIWHKVPGIPGPHLVQFLFWLLANSIIRRWNSAVSSGLDRGLVFSAGINSLRADVILVHALFHRLRETSRSRSSRNVPRPGLFRNLHRRAYYSFLAALERRTYSDPSTSLAAVSGRTASLLATYFRRKDVTIVPNGVDCTQFCPSARLALRSHARSRRGLNEHDFVVLLIGNDWTTKGVPALLVAIAALPHAPVSLLAVGADDPGPYREMANRLGLRQRCQWEKPRDDVIDLYAAADAYASPSREDSFGLPVLEAMACGLPVITSQCAGVSELIRNGVDGFILTDLQDIQGLSQIFGRLYENHSLRSSLGESAANTARSWTWDRSAAALWELIQDVARKKEGRG